MRDEAEDVVSESFAQVLELVRRGQGPQTAFRAYLFTTIRNGAARRAKARQKLIPTDDVATIDTLVGFGAGQLDAFELSAIRAAYDSLPERWRTVLWQVEVERRKPQELAETLGLSPNGVSALAYRARVALREAYLKQHINPVSAGSRRTCRETQDSLPAMVRGTLAEGRHERVRVHLHGCADCSSILLELRDANNAVGGPARAG
jgi:RNA polymerase sigma factor (sigma-70 family)